MKDKEDDMNAIAQSIQGFSSGQLEAIVKIAPRLAMLNPKQLEAVLKQAAVQKIVNEADTALTIAGIDYDTERGAFLDRLKSDHTRRAYGSALTRIEAWTDREHINPLTLSYKQADDFIAWLKSEGRAAASVRRDIAAVSAFLSWLERRYAGVKNVFRGTKDRPADVPKKTPKVPTAAEVDRIIQSLSPELAAAVSVMAFRGLRCGALPSLTTWGGRFTAFSKGKQISGELPPRALKAIEAAGLSLKAPFTGQVTNNLEKAIEYYIKKMYKAGQVEAVYSCHGFRHFYAITEYSKDNDIHKVKDLLGHSSIAVTDRYLRSLGAL